MARSFTELKQTSADRFEKLRSLMRPDLGAHKSTRLKLAGCGELKTLLHDEIAKRHAKMLQGDYEKLWGKLTRDIALKRLRFLTFLHSVAPLYQRDIIRAIGGMESALLRVFKGSETKVLGAIEVEIVNIALLRKIGSQNDDEKRKLNVLENIWLSGSSGKSVAGD